MPSTVPLPSSLTAPHTTFSSPIWCKEVVKWAEAARRLRRLQLAVLILHCCMTCLAAWRQRYVCVCVCVCVCVYVYVCVFFHNCIACVDETHEESNVCAYVCVNVCVYVFRREFGYGLVFIQK